MKKLSVTRQKALEEVYKHQYTGFISRYSLNVNNAALNWLIKEKYITCSSSMQGALVSCTDKGLEYLRSDYS